MSVPAGKRKKNELEAEVRAKNLAAYTTKIMANPKKFDPKYTDVLGNKIIDSAHEIYLNTKRGNELYVIKVSTSIPFFDDVAWKARKEFQRQALYECDRLLMYIEMAKSVYTDEDVKGHRPRINYAAWGRMAAETKKVIKGWTVADLRNMTRERKRMEALGQVRSGSP
ncbi:hypothetical protein IKE71_01435 [Candidatus Saccharibacteria bacterium]|nr:hypothetical protein [Candidatus Saccharibacteria bacterium]